MKLRSIVIAGEIGRNLAMLIPPVRRWRCKRGRTLEQHPDLLFRYAYSQYELVTQAVSEEALDGLDVAEIGPGDHIPTALLLLGAGVRSYTGIDRFQGEIASASAKDFYARLVNDMRTRYPRLYHSLRDRQITPDAFPDRTPGLIHYVNAPIETASRACDRRFDLIFSSSVIGMVNEIHLAARSMFDLLQPGGVAVHRIDLGPPRPLLDDTDPLAFLRIPEPIWQAMGSQRGYPNRRRLHEITAAFTSSGVDVQVTEMDGVPREQAEAQRSSLAKRFRDMDPESLRIMYAVLICRRPRA